MSLVDHKFEVRLVAPEASLDSICRSIEGLEDFAHYNSKVAIAGTAEPGIYQLIVSVLPQGPSPDGIGPGGPFGSTVSYLVKTKTSEWLLPNIP